MPVINWMRAHVGHFAQIPPHEVDEAMQFALLWSYFEAAALRRNAKVAEIDRWVGELEQRGVLRAVELEPTLQYFRTRYLDAHGDLNHQFNTLNFTTTQAPLVAEVLLRQRQLPAEMTNAVLRIIYRIRNNFIHGEKWADDLHDQYHNFHHANDTLMRVMDWDAGR